MLVSQGCASSTPHSGHQERSPEGGPRRQRSLSRFTNLLHVEAAIRVLPGRSSQSAARRQEPAAAAAAAAAAANADVNRWHHLQRRDTTHALIFQQIEVRPAVYAGRRSTCRVIYSSGKIASSRQRCRKKIVTAGELSLQFRCDNLVILMLFSNVYGNSVVKKHAAVTAHQGRACNHCWCWFLLGEITMMSF